MIKAAPSTDRSRRNRVARVRRHSRVGPTREAAVQRPDFHEAFPAQPAAHPSRGGIVRTAAINHDHARPKRSIDISRRIRIKQFSAGIRTPCSSRSACLLIDNQRRRVRSHHDVELARRDDPAAQPSSDAPAQQVSIDQVDKSSRRQHVQNGRPEWPQNHQQHGQLLLEERTAQQPERRPRNRTGRVPGQRT